MPPLYLLIVLLCPRYCKSNIQSSHLKFSSSCLLDLSASHHRLLGRYLPPDHDPAISAVEIFAISQGPSSRHLVGRGFTSCLSTYTYLAHFFFQLSNVHSPPALMIRLKYAWAYQPFVALISLTSPAFGSASNPCPTLTFMGSFSILQLLQPLSPASLCSGASFIYRQSCFSVSRFDLDQRELLSSTLIGSKFR